MGNISFFFYADDINMLGENLQTVRKDTEIFMKVWKYRVYWLAGPGFLRIFVLALASQFSRSWGGSIYPVRKK